MNNVLKKSVIKQFLYLMLFFIFVVLLFAAGLYMHNDKAKSEFVKKINILNQKYELIEKIDVSLENALFESRGYLAFQLPVFLESMENNRKNLAIWIAQYEQLPLASKDKQFLERINNFNYYFFNDLFPTALIEVEAGNLNRLRELSQNEGNTKRIEEFKAYTTDFRIGIEKEIIEQTNKFTIRTNRSQNYFIVFILFIMILTTFIASHIVKILGVPLKELAFASRQFADGGKVELKYNDRKDEIGTLSLSLQSMITKVQEKEHKLIEQYVESELEREANQSIMDSIREGIHYVDAHGKILKVNYQMCQFMNSCNMEQMIGRSMHEWQELFKRNVPEYEELFQFFIDVIKGEKKKNEVIRYKLNTNTPKIIQVYYEKIYKYGETVGIIFVHRDITKEYEVDQMKSELVNTVSHELRTPLSSVLGYTELMLYRNLKPEKQKKYLTTIYQEAKRLTALINDYLDVQRMESGKYTFTKQIVDIMPLISEVIEENKVHSKIHVFTVIQLTAMTTVFADKDKLKQVFTNIVSNAVKYSPNGGEVKVTVQLKDQKLAISVCDEGLGIPKDEMSKLFTKFYRIDRLNERWIAGTGLGLAISKEIMKAHYGQITVDSKYGKGSTFTLLFPLL
jgi:signal transduction histidine kinase